MKNKKYCHVTACCWGYRHELLGLILLILATILTIATCNSFGIVAMFFAGIILCCCKHFAHCHTEAHCHTDDGMSGEACMEHDHKSPVKKSTHKTKTKA